MRVERLRLDGWRGFEHLDLALHPRLTLLVGENGSGKTAVLEALALALDVTVNVAVTTGFRLPGESVRIGAEHVRVELDLRQDDGTVVTQKLQAPKQGSTFGAPWQIMPHTATDPWPVAVLYGTERTVRDLTPADNGGTRDFAASTEQKTALDPQGVSFDRFFEWFQVRENVENEHRVDDPSHRDPQLEAVRTAISRLTGFSSIRIRREPRNRLTVVKDEERLLFDQLSSGERALIAVVADVARRLAIAHRGAGDPLGAGGIVLIDEIDLHLHPRWQRQALTRLLETFPGVQWVTTTHSPITAMYVDRDCVRVLDRFRLVEAPFTRGRDANALYADLFGIDERPRETLERLDELGRRIDRGDLSGARELLDVLARDLGESDPTVVEQRVALGLAAE